MKMLNYNLTLVFDVQGERIEVKLPNEGEMANTINQFVLSNPGWEHETVMSSVLGRLLGTLEHPQVLDVGAFVGYYTVLASKLIGRRGRVWAIESNPGWADIVRQIIALNGLDNAEVIHTALSDRSESLRSIRQEVSTELGGGFTIQAETCDAMCQRLGLRPNVAKMDVHGFEGKVLRGMQEIMNTTLEYLLLELHNAEFLHKYTPDISRVDVLDCLESIGFKSYHVAGHGYSESEARLIVDTGRYSYYPLTRENRDVLMFDRHSKVFVLAAKHPIEDVLGPSIVDPGLLAIASYGHSTPSGPTAASGRERRPDRVAAAALD